MTVEQFVLMMRIIPYETTRGEECKKEQRSLAASSTLLLLLIKRSNGLAGSKVSIIMVASGICNFHDDLLAKYLLYLLWITVEILHMQQDTGRDKYKLDELLRAEWFTLILQNAIQERGGNIYQDSSYVYIHSIPSHGIIPV